MIEALNGAIQPYAWGSTTAIPELLGVEPSGEPQAELWLGAHPSAPSEVDGKPLTELIEADPQTFLGARSVEVFGPRLPFLTKILAAAQPLSLQAHPSRQQAEAGFERENTAGVAVDAPERVYRDAWPKPEMLCALGDFEALCGFRDPQETYQLFAALEIDQVIDVVEPLRAGGEEGVRQAFAQLLFASHPEMLVGAVVSLCKGFADRTDAMGDFARTAVEVGHFYPGDPGVLAALLMNRLSLPRFEALFLPAGNLHAYLKGTGVEVMANSDNVMRGGLTPKHIAVDELLDTLDFTPGVPDLVPVTEQSDGVFRYETPAPEFGVWRLEPNGSRLDLPAAGSGRILLVTDGDVVVKGGRHKLKLGRGQSAYLTADEAGVSLGGDGTAFLSAPGI